MKNIVQLGVSVCIALCGAATTARAQHPLEWDAAQPSITRADLEQLRARLDSAAASSGYSNELRSRARLQAAAAQKRLKEGDFQVGDRVMVVVEGQFTDTFDVRPGRLLALPTVGEIPLEGVLRSELDGRLKEYVARVIVEPVVRARPLVNIAVIGEVLRPGYYAMQIDALLSDALMEAGGPTPTANLDQLSIQRGNQRIYGPQALQEAIAAGKTLNQMGLRGGDRINVPTQQRRGVGELARLVIVALPSLAFLLSQMSAN